MKKIAIVFAIAILMFVLFICAIIIPRSDTKNAKVVISSDYSTITYEGKVYVPIELEKLPFEVKNGFFMSRGPGIKATVENENYFLDKCFFTNYIHVKEYDGEKFIYLNTDYDVNESDYYCSQAYKQKVENAEMHKGE